MNHPGLLELLSYTDFAKAPSLFDWACWQGVPGFVTALFLIATIFAVVLQVKVGNLMKITLILGALSLVAGVFAYVRNYNHFIWEVTLWKVPEDTYATFATWAVLPLLIGGSAFFLAFLNLILIAVYEAKAHSRSRTKGSS
jgi:hypothetical protein